MTGKGRQQAKVSLQDVITRQIFKSFPDAVQLHFNATITISLDMSEQFVININATENIKDHNGFNLVQKIKTEIDESARVDPSNEYPPSEVPSRKRGRSPEDSDEDWKDDDHSQDPESGAEEVSDTVEEDKEPCELSDEALDMPYLGDIQDDARELGDGVKPKTGKLVECPQCDYKSAWSKNVKRHIKRQHNSICQYCAEDCGGHAALKEHIAQQHKDKKVICKLCQKEFKSLRGLVYHNARSHGARGSSHTETKQTSLQDENTSGTNSKQTSVEEHRPTDISNVQQSLRCDYCGAEFGDKKQLKDHQRKTHRESRRVECKYCEKVYFSKNGFSAHMRLSHPEHVKLRKRKASANEAHVCHICGKEYPIWEYLKAHIRYHTQEKRFQCPKCQQQFKYRSGFKNHVEGCLNESGYPCEICGKTYKNDYTLKLHIRHKHMANTYPCRICKSKFTYRTQRNQHEQTCSGSGMMGEGSNMKIEPNSKQAKLQEKYTVDYKKRFGKNLVLGGEEEHSNVVDVTLSGTMSQDDENTPEKIEHIDGREESVYDTIDFHMGDQTDAIDNPSVPLHNFSVQMF